MSVTLELVVEARNRANAALTQIEGQLDRISASGVSVADKLASASKSIGLVGAAFTAGVTAPIVGSATAILSAAGQLEQYQVAFTTMLGSQEKATKLLKDLQDFSAQTPFELPQIIQAGRQLLAYGFSAEEVKKHLQLLGDVASGTGTRIEDLTYLYGTLAVQGRVYGRDILQFTNRGIPALDALAASLGKSKSEVMELVKEGSINFEDIVTAFEKLTGAGGRFEGMMQAQSQTLLGLVSTFKDNFFIAMSQIGLQLVETFDLRTKVKSALDVLEQVRVKLLELIQTNPEIVKMGVIFLAAAAMIGPFLLALSALVSVAGFVAAGLSTLGAIVGALFSPFGLLIAVVAGVAYAFYNDWGGIATFVGGVVNRLGEIFDSLRQYFGAVVEDGDYLNDFLRDLPRWMQPVVAKAGELFAKFQELGGLSGIFALLQTRVKESLDLIYSTVNEKIPIIGELLSDLKSAAQWLWEGKGKNIDWWNDITDNMVRLGLMSQSTADRLGEALFNMGASFTTAREKALEFKDGMVARLTEMYTAAKPQIDSMIETVGAMIPTFDEVKNAAFNLWVTVSSAFAIIYLWLQVNLPVAIATFKETWSTIWTEAPQKVESAKATVTAAFDAIKEAWNTAVTFLQPTIENIKTDFTKFGEDLDGVGSALKNLFNALVPYIGALAAGLGVALIAITNIVSAVIGSLPNFVEGIINTIAAFLDGLGKNVYDMVTLVTQLINGDWAAAWDTAQQIAWRTVTTLQIMGASLWLSITAVFTAIWTSITNILNQLGVDVDSFTTSFKAAWEGAWTAMEIGFTAAKDVVVQGFLSLKLWFTATLPNALTDLKTSFTNKWTEIKAAYESAAGPIVDSLKTIYDYVATKIQTALTGLENFFKGLKLPNPFSGLQSALSGMIENVQWLLNNIPGLGGAVDAANGGSPAPQQNAIGTSFNRGGLTLVGERGPELVMMPRGAQVLNNRETKKALDEPRNVTIVIQEPALYGGLTMADLVNQIAEEIQRRM